jgi:hypothetical protein
LGLDDFKLPRRSVELLFGVDFETWWHSFIANSNAKVKQRELCSHGAWNPRLQLISGCGNFDELCACAIVLVRSAAPSCVRTAISPHAQCASLLLYYPQCTTSRSVFLRL